MHLMHVGSYSGQRENSGLELQLQTVVSQQRWLLGIKLRFSAKAATTLNH